MEVDMSGLDFYSKAIAVDDIHPILLVAAIHLPIVLAIVIELVEWYRRRREERRLWSPVVMYPYVVPGPE